MFLKHILSTVIHKGQSNRPDWLWFNWAGGLSQKELGDSHQSDDLLCSDLDVH